MRLSAHFGCPWPERLAATLTSRQLARWYAYMDLEPFGGRQDDLRAARVAEAVYGAAGVRVAPGELFPSLARRTTGKGPSMDWGALKATLRALYGTRPRAEAASG